MTAPVQQPVKKVRTEDFSVKFGLTPDMGFEDQKAFPFIYSFVNANNVSWSPSGNFTGMSLSLIGPTVQPAVPLTWDVLLDPDYNYKLLAIRYSAYYKNTVTSAFEWYTNVYTPQSDGMDPDMEKIGTPLFRYIGITLSFQGSGSVIMYGGPNTGPMQMGVAGGGRVPLPLTLIEGYDYGYMAARTEYLLPREGHMVFEISNTWTSPLIVAGAIYGMKIRL